MPHFHDNALIGAAGGSSYQISRSLRFNSLDSSYLSRTPSVTGNRRTFTWAGWVKRSEVVSGQTLFNAWNGILSDLNYWRIILNGAFLQVSGYSSVYLATSTALRDVSAWYHVLVAVDTTNATADNRIRIYINGIEQTAFTTRSNPAQNTDFVVNTIAEHNIGRSLDPGTYCDCYLTDVHFVDGQALTPSSFGEADVLTGEWTPKAYAGTYGTNGFKLNFADNSAATAAALGKDTSGNGNNWTPINLSVTAGAGNDSFVDTPTSYGVDTGVGGEVRGNYAVMNPLHIKNDSGGGSATLSDGNLKVTTDTGSGSGAGATIAVNRPGGSFYWEVQPISGVTTASAACQIGLAERGAPDGVRLNDYSYTSSETTTYTNGDIIGCAYNSSTSTLTFYKNGVLAKTMTSVATTLPLFPFIRDNIADSIIAVFNFGQRPFAYAAPSGYKALCDTNLSAPTITKPSTVIDIVTYTGTGASLTPTSSLAFSPDLVWIKSRSASTDHALYDIVRGATFDIASNLAAAETTQAQGVTAFNSNGFTVGTLAKINTNTATYTGWCWDAGSSTVTNTSGTISSQVRANASAGFSIVTYTGNGVQGATVGHGLGATPRFIIVKNRSSAISWTVYHVSLGAGQELQLDANAASTVSLSWNNSNPISTNFAIGSNTNANTNNFVAYCFAEVTNYSSFRNYTGNGNGDGPFVYTGFRSRFIMIKQATSASATDWIMIDAARLGYNASNNRLLANTLAAELNVDWLDITSNGFKIRTTDAALNAASGNYIYAAFAEFPFQHARAR